VGLKEDADFARFVSMGAVATDAVRNDLKHFGHAAIELERYAMANKVWQTKVKRLRLPDLVCSRCGLRIESRGKSQLGIILSHSTSGAEGRTWDGGGIRDSDLFAFLRLDLISTPPHTSEPVYFRTSDLRAVVSSAKESGRKASSEGSEVTLTWPTWVPTWSGVFTGPDADGRLICKRDDGSSATYWQWRRWPARYLYISPGDLIIGSETMVAGIIAPPGDITCPGGWDLRAALSDSDQAERYAAAKVTGILGRTDLADQLTAIARREPDWRLRLEATASLARLDAQWLRPIIEMATTPENPGEQRIEAVFVLSEISTDEAAEALAEIAEGDGEKPTELRAAAVWGLACGVRPRPDLVLLYATDSDELVALHAIAGMPSLPESLIPGLLDWLGDDDAHAAAAAQVLMRHKAVRPLLEAVHRGGRGRLWALRALGDLPPELVQEAGAELLTEEIREDLEPIWIAHDDWLRGPGAEGLEALDVQKVRFSPLIG
jgi:HEAT repeat protein